MLAHLRVSATFLRHSRSARSRHGSCAPWIAWDCDLAARRFHPKLVSRETYRSKIRPRAHPWKLAHQRVAPRGRRAQGPLYLERFTLATSLMLLGRSSEPRSPVVRFHVKRAGRERQVAGSVPGQRAPTSAIDGIARCGRRCHGRQYSDAAGPPPDLPNPFVLSAEAAHQSLRTASCGNWVLMTSIRGHLWSGTDARGARTTVFHVKPPATGRLLDALVPTSLQDRTTRPAPSRTEPPRAPRGASTAVTIHTPSPCPVVRRNRRLSRAHQHRRGIYGRTP